MRLDQALVVLSLVPSRSKAQELIKANRVEVFVNEKWQTINKSSFFFNESEVLVNKIRILDNDLLNFVSRAGLKLDYFLKESNFKVFDFKVLDVGQSTGGFSQCLLFHKAKKVIGIDVGKGQLAESLRESKDYLSRKLICLENINAKELNQCENIMQHYPFDLVVMDVSFISQIQLYAQIHKVLNFKGYFLALVKPQFELGANSLNKKGVVKDKLLYDKLELKIKKNLKEHGFDVIQYLESKLEGKDGNKEFFVLSQKC